MSPNYTERPRKEIVTICLDVEQFKLLKKVLDIEGSSSRSELIRKIIDQYLLDYWKMLRTLDLLTDEQKRVMRE